jgi:HPt (histidine-containing phosphotransfer) domain-containing protein
MGEDASLIVESYVESIDEFLSDISNRTLCTPSADLHRWAHTIKSSAASTGAMRLATETIGPRLTGNIRGLRLGLRR